MLLGWPFLAAVTLASQSPESSPSQRRADSPAPVAKSVAATRAAQPPVIDGRDDDAVWRQAPPITEFQEWRPSEGGAPKLPTEAKVAYDAGNLYVFVRSFDPHPDSIITVLARRDSGHLPVHREHVAPGVRTAIHLEGDVPQRA